VIARTAAAVLGFARGTAMFIALSIFIVGTVAKISALL
jgi:hypothetical protein